MIAQVHGYCVGSGTYYGLFTDITVAADDAYFQMPLLQGHGLPGGETMIEPWIFMNWKRASEYLYTAQRLTAEQALQMGLVNRVVPRFELEHVVEDLAAEMRAYLSQHLWRPRPCSSEPGSSWAYECTCRCLLT